jgi:hypothetical protein
MVRASLMRDAFFIRYAGRPHREQIRQYVTVNTYFVQLRILLSV